MDDGNRRRTARYPAGENQARLLWEEGPDVLESRARLLDVSGEGARFFADSLPPAGSDVCFRLEVPSKSGWVLATVVRLDGPTGGALSFTRYCPSDLIGIARRPTATVLSA